MKSKFYEGTVLFING